MKVVILAGGFGTRLSEETIIKPKPMIEIGGKPILWHIMKLYSHYGFNEFIICLGYKGNIIKEYFTNYYLNQSSLTIDLLNNKTKIHKNTSEPWTVTLVDTGLDTMTGGRIKKIQEYIGDSTFMLTYGDGIADIDINKLLEVHREKQMFATVTSMSPKGRFGLLNVDKNNVVKSFSEKPQNSEDLISGGFFVLEPEIFDYIKDNDDSVSWEKEPLENIAKDGQLATYTHKGFWMPMDKLSDKNELENLWNSNNAKWKVWSE